MVLGLTKPGRNALAFAVRNFGDLLGRELVGEIAPGGCVVVGGGHG